MSHQHVQAKLRNLHSIALKTRSRVTSIYERGQEKSIEYSQLQEINHLNFDFFIVRDIARFNSANLFNQVKFIQSIFLFRYYGYITFILCVNLIQNYIILQVSINKCQSITIKLYTSNLRYLISHDLNQFMVRQHVMQATCYIRQLLVY